MRGGVHLVKPLHLNLASRPYRDYRPLYAVVVVTSLAIFFLMLNNAETGYRYLRETKTTRAKIENIDRQVQAEEQRTHDLNQRLHAVNLKLLADQTQFANARLAERAFSWSELLDRLERVLPGDVRIDSVAPSFGRNGLVHLSLTAFSKSGDGMVHTLDRLNRDTRFTGAFPTSEERTDTGYRFAIGVDYRPSIARVVE
jgi:Tfp pilus assembly protein PilN